MRARHRTHSRVTSATPWNGLAQAVALISALTYIAAAPLELFFFSSPRVRALLHIEADNVADVRMWAFCIGLPQPARRHRRDHRTGHPLDRRGGNRSSHRHNRAVLHAPR